MFALALSLLLGVSTPQEATDGSWCDRLYAETDALYMKLAGQHVKPADDLRRLAALARETRLCYGGTRRGRVMDLYYDEVFALKELRRYQEAFQALDGFFQQFASEPDSAWFPVMYAYRGNLHEALGELAKAIADYGHAFSYAPADQPDRQANLLINAGTIFQRMQDFESARSYFERAAHLLRTPPAPERRALHLRQQARALHELATLVVTQAAPHPRAYPEALANASQHFRESIALHRQAGSRRELFFSILALGEALSYRDSLDAAYRYMQAAATISAELGDPALQGFAAYRFGRLHLQLHDYDAARNALAEALPLAEAGKNDEYRRRILNHLGLLHELRGDYGEAQRAYRDALLVTEEARMGLGATQWSALAFSQWQEPYRGLVRVLLAGDRPREAFAVLERTRARHLRDLQLQARLLADSSFAQRGRLDSLQIALEAVRNHLGRVGPSDLARTDLLAQEARLAAARDALLAVDDTLPLPTLETIQQQLAPRGRVLISYFLDQPDPLFGRPARSYVLLLTADTLAALPLAADVPTVQAVLARVSPLLSPGSDAAGLNAFQFSTSALRQLYDLVFAPLADRLPDGAPLVLIPDGPLFLVPFGALLTADAPPFQYRTAPFLLRDHPTAVELSASLLVEPTARRPDPALDVLAFGKTRFPGVRLPRAYFASAVLAADSSLPALPAVADELSSIRALFRKTDIVQDEAATEAALLTRLDQSKVVHIASHALLNPFSPLHDAIILSPGATQEADDGVLFLHELQHHGLHTRLVVLSGCNTARGMLLSGEGMAGLQYAFRSMGVESTLATLWLVEDEASARLMALFYRNLRDRLPKDVALQQAQLAFLEEAPDAATSPFFWAAPVLYGSTEALPLQPRFWGVVRWPQVLAGLVLAVAAAVLYLRWYRPGARRNPE